MNLPTNFRSGRVKDNCIWFFDNIYKCVCKMDIATNTVETLAGGYWDFECATTYINGDNVYFAPLFYVKILIYNIKEHTVKEIKFEDDPKMDIKYKIYWPVEYDNKIWFASQYTKSGFCYFDCQEEKFYADTKVKDLLKNEVTPEHFLGMLPTNYCSQYWGVIDRTNKYFKYNFLNGKGEIFTLDRQVMLSHVRYDGDNVWLLQYDSNSILKVGKEIKEFKVDTIAEEPFSYIYIFEKYIVVLPRFSDVVVLIDKETEEVNPMSLPIKGEYRSDVCKIIDCCEHNNKIYLFPHGLKDLYVLDETDLSIQVIEPDYLDFEKMENDLDIHNRKESLKYIPTISEDENLTCELFIDFVKELDIRKDLEEKKKKSVGEEIWRYFSSNLKN